MGDFKGLFYLFVAIVKFKPADATTNPSLILAAAQLPQYAHLVQKAIESARKESADQPEKAPFKALEILVNSFELASYHITSLDGCFRSGNPENCSGSGVDRGTCGVEL